jgi:hypothetical protein
LENEEDVSAFRPAPRWPAVAAPSPIDALQINLEAQLRQQVNANQRDGV